MRNYIWTICYVDGSHTSQRVQYRDMQAADANAAAAVLLCDDVTSITVEELP